MITVLSVNTDIRSREFFQVTTFSCASFAEIAPFGRAILAANINNGINVGYFHRLPPKERYSLRYRKKYVTVRQRSLKVPHNQGKRLHIPVTEMQTAILQSNNNCSLYHQIFLRNSAIFAF